MALAIAGEVSTSAIPSPEDNVRFETLKKELAEQLGRKRATERQLVSGHP